MFSDLIENIIANKEFYSKELFLVCIFDKELGRKVGDSEVYISEFIVAKILGFIKNLNGHPDVSVEFLLSLPQILNKPDKVLRDIKNLNKVFLICGQDAHRVVLEIKRNNNKTEINTIHKIRETTLNKLEKKCILL